MATQRDDAVEWVGGSYAGPGDVVEHGVSTRPDVVLWMVQPAGLIVNTAVVDAPAAPEAVADVLTETLELPLPAGGAFRVRVSNPAVAAVLRRRLGNAVPVVVAPTPDLDAVAADMQHALGRTRRPRDRGYLARGTIPADDVARLFTAAADLWTVAPWRIASDDQVLALDIPALDVAGACVCILGFLEESYGFIIFESFDAYARFAEQMPDDGPGPDRIDMTGYVAGLDYALGRDLSKLRRREIRTHGWPVAGPSAYPHVVCVEPDGTPRPETPHEVRLVAACAEALAGFFRRHAGLFEHEPTGTLTDAFEVLGPDGDMIVGLTAPHPDWLREAPAPPLPRVGRNDPCPCGSGRKYKKCHLDASPVAAVPSSPAQALELDCRMMRSVLTFADARQREFPLAPDVRLVGHPEFDGPWLVFHERTGDRRVIDRFAESRHHALDPIERAWVAAQQETRLSVWEVVDTVRGRSLELRDQLTGEVRVVSDEAVSARVRRGDRILARVLDLAGVTILSGLHPQPLRPSAAAIVTRAVKRALRTRARLMPQPALRLPAAERALRDAWIDACTAERERLGNMRLSNTDGHAILLTVDHFGFDETARAAVDDALAGLAERDEDDTDGAGTRFTVTAAGKVAGLERVSIASIDVGDGKLSIATNSRERADAIRSLVEGACGTLIRHRAREHTDPRALVGREPAASQVTAEPPPEAAQLVLEFKRRHYDTWPDEPLPALDGCTPREALERPAMRRRLALLLDDMEHAEGSVPADQRFDFAALRTTLGLDD